MNKAIWSGLLVVCAAIFLGGACDEASPMTPTPPDPTLNVSTDPQKTDAINGNPVIYTDCASVPVPASSACTSLSGSVTVTESNGATGPADGAVLTSSNTQVAAVAAGPNGTFTTDAIAPGEFQISATYQGLSDSINLRAIPYYAGDYFGDEEINACTATGDFEAADACTSGAFPEVGDRLAHSLDVGQAVEMVTVVYDLGGGQSLTMSAPVATDGQLFMPGPFSQPIPGGTFAVSNYDVRLAGSSELVGNFTIVITSPVLSGSLTYGSTLVDVMRLMPASTAARSLPDASDPLTFSEAIQRGLRTIR